MDSHEAAGLAGSFGVQSTDGTTIRVWVQGKGPPIVLVHGSLRDYTIFEPLVAHLQPAMTTYAIDRRGFGASGDGDGYTIEQEFEDVAAVVDAIAARAGSVALWGHSYGAGCAMGAAALTNNVSRVILYEPGLGIAYPPGWLETHEEALAGGDAEKVIRAVLIDILEMSEEDVETRRAAPQWPAYLNAAATVLREARTEHTWVYRPGALDRVDAPTLVLVGAETSPALMRSTLRAAAAIPGARTQVLGGHGHLACITDPSLIASIITQFCGIGEVRPLDRRCRSRPPATSVSGCAPRRQTGGTLYLSVVLGPACRFLAFASNATDQWGSEMRQLFRRDIDTRWEPWPSPM